jgi:import receptor subunit TOM20
MSLQSKDDPLSLSFCSRECQTAAGNSYAKLLFSLEPVAPELASEITPDMTRKRKKAQEAFVAFLQNQDAKFRSYAYLTAQFVAVYLLQELLQIALGVSSGDANYTLSDHLERLRYLDFSNMEEQYKVVANLFENAMPGMEQFLPAQRFNILMGKIAYNTFGVCYSGGRDDKVGYDKACDVVRTNRVILL